VGKGCSKRRAFGDASVRSVGVVEVLELLQGMEEMPLVPDQGAVQEFTPAGLHPAFPWSS
jgi:hypothetical protein